LRYDIRMKSEPATTERDRFNSLVSQVLSVPKAEIQKILAEDKRKPGASPNKRGTKRKLKQPA
jgi:hypothetical protein